MDEATGHNRVIDPLVFEVFIYILRYRTLYCVDLMTTENGCGTLRTFSGGYTRKMRSEDYRDEVN